MCRLKPTKGRIPLTGSVPLSPSLDHIGPLAATVEEAAILLDALSDPRLAPCLSPARPTDQCPPNGYARDWFANDPACDPAVLRALDDTASALSLLGARIESISLPDYALWETAGALILDAEALEANRSRITTHGALYGKPSLRSLLRATSLTAADIDTAWQATRLFAADLDTALSSHDAISRPPLCPPPRPLPPFAAAVQSGRRCELSLQRQWPPCHLGTRRLHPRSPPWCAAHFRPRCRSHADPHRPCFRAGDRSRSPEASRLSLASASRMFFV